MAYSLDTSYLMRAWNSWYPYEVFPAVWQVLVTMVKSGQVIVIDPVAVELANQAPKLLTFLDHFAPNWKVKVANDTRLRDAMDELEHDLLAGKVIREYVGPNVAKYMLVADPHLVLHADLYGHIVVSNEVTNRLDKKGPKIPDLCDVRGVVHADPAEFAGALGFSFNVASPVA